MPWPAIIGAVARVAGSAVGRSVATRAGASAATTESVSRLGSFVGGATANTLYAHRAEREAERTNPNTPEPDPAYPPYDSWR